MQLIWQLIAESGKQDVNRDLYNGAVEALYTLIGKYVLALSLNMGSYMTDL